MESDIFKEEAYDLLEDIEEALLELGKDPTDTELLNRLFRDFHTIKGSGAMFGFSHVSVFTHSVETAIDLVRQGKILFSEEMMELVLQAHDQILSLIDSDDSEAEFQSPETQALLAQLAAVVSGEIVPDNDKSSSSAVAPPVPQREEQPYRPPAPQAIPADFIAEIDELFDSISSIIEGLRKDHNASKLVNKLYRTIHTIQGSSAMYEYEQLADFCYQVQSAVNSVKQGFAVVTDHALDLILEAKDLMRVSLELNDDADVSHKNKLADIVEQLQDWAVSPGDNSSIKNNNEQESSSAKKLEKQKLLIVEDEFVSRYLLEEFLSSYGTSHSAVDGYEAVLAFKTALTEKRPYNLVCLDIMMPGLDGREVAKEIRRLEKELHVEIACKVVMTTAVTDEKIKDDMLASGLCDAYLTKPLQLDKLIELINKFFGG